MELTASATEVGTDKSKASSTRGGGDLPMSSVPLSSASVPGETAAAAAAVAGATPVARATSIGGSVASSSSSQPLEEVNPSVLNAKDFPSNGSSSGGGGASGVGGGKEGGCAPLPPASSLEASLSPGGDNGRGGDSGGDSGTPGGMLPVPPARSAGTGARSAVVDRRSAGSAPVRSAAAAVAERSPGGSGGSPERAIKPPAVGGGEGGGGSGVGGVEETGSSRFKGKSVEAHGSTGVSPMQKRNRRELKVGECLIVAVVVGDRGLKIWWRAA